MKYSREEEGVKETYEGTVDEIMALIDYIDLEGITIVERDIDLE